MIVADRTIVAANISLAWADALAFLVDTKPHRAVNLTIRITDPQVEDEAIRAVADETLERFKLQDVTEVANTIFPKDWADDYPEPRELAQDYRDHYDFLRSLGSDKGTYFGRIVAYPDPETGRTIDQLTDNVDKLLKAQARRQVYKSAYQINIFSPKNDRNKGRGFPCLAHVGMHIGADDRLHATAQYRSHDVLAKGYGNYLGLAGLMTYFARAVGLEPGELLVVAGGAFFDGSARRLASVRAALEPLREQRA